ncbi:MAG TPA: hypothetical protein VE871_07840 [Longimicrobium sp.]|nr:hypothetical protein [Longimicrobium sp.]
MGNAVVPEIPQIAEILERFASALDTLQKRDGYLFEHDVAERAITHKLAEYLQPLFAEWDVDCEYNRNRHESKRVGLPDPNSPEALLYVSVYPDIIVHKRGGNKHNILIIEAKKLHERGAEGELRDRNKLIAYARDLDYQVGVFLLLPTGAEFRTRCRYEYYVDRTWRASSDSPLEAIQ